MKKGKLITIGGAIVVLALCGYFFMGTSSKGKISFQTEKVTRNSMTDVVVATGTVEPVTRWMSVRRFRVSSTVSMSTTIVL